jgi:predicted transcriptional regulator
MNIQAEKLDIIQWLAKINDSKIIRQFVLLKRMSEEAGPLTLSQEEKEAIEKGLKAVEEGRYQTHEEVMAATKKKYAHLFK